MYLSLEAQKAKQAGEVRRRSYWPKLSKTETLFILECPHRFRRGGRKNFADYVYRELSLFGFNSKKDRWEAPLTLEAYHQIVDKFTLAGEPQVRVSDEVKTWVDCANAAEQAKKRYNEAGGQERYSRERNAEYYLSKARKCRLGSPLRRYYMELARERMSPQERKDKAAKDTKDLFG